MHQLAYNFMSVSSGRTALPAAWNRQRGRGRPNEMPTQPSPSVDLASFRANKSANLARAATGEGLYAPNKMKAEVVE